MHILHGMALAIPLMISGLANATSQPIEGHWRTIDDKTGFAKAITEITQEPDGTYSATIKQVIPRPGYTPKEFCQNCPAPFTNKPILGLRILWGLKPDPKREQTYIGGSVLDPLNGKIYSAKGRVSTDGRRLSLRAYLGFSMIGRTPIWIREGSVIDADGLGRMPTAEK
jgi:uncharacterized protein (DUF2147 family)